VHGASIGGGGGGGGVCLSAGPKRQPPAPSPPPRAAGRQPSPTSVKVCGRIGSYHLWNILGQVVIQTRD
jgi:hypothetical protein